MSTEVSKICKEVQTHLPAYTDRSLPRLRHRMVGLHLRRCAECQEQFSRQRAVMDGLTALLAPPGMPPDGLLNALLQQAARPGLVARTAIPARGAVSGARPGLSAALLVSGAVAGTGLGFAAWRGAKRFRHLRPGHR